VSGRGGEVSQLRHRGEDAASGRVASLASYCTVTRDREGEGVQKALSPGGGVCVCVREPKDSISTQTQQCLFPTVGQQYFLAAQCGLILLTIPGLSPKLM
jgi:hypothetical protein